jgi:hypothetical protein
MITRVQFDRDAIHPAPHAKGNAVKRLLVSGIAMLAAASIAGCGDDDESMTAPTTNYVQVDRMAIPAFNTALIPSAQKEAFNRSSPLNDVANYKTTVIGTITSLRAAVATRLGPETGNLTPTQLADIIVPDVVTIDFSQPLVFPNGRGPDDEVIDPVLSLVLNRNVSDAVGNDNTTLSTFPYLGVPNTLPKPGL